MNPWAVSLYFAILNMILNAVDVSSAVWAKITTNMRDFQPKMSWTQVKISSSAVCITCSIFPPLWTFPSSNKNDVQSNDDSTNTSVTPKNTPAIESGVVKDDGDENVIKLDHANNSYGGGEVDVEVVCEIDSVLSTNPSTSSTQKNNSHIW